MALTLWYKHERGDVGVVSLASENAHVPRARMVDSLAYNPLLSTEPAFGARYVSDVTQLQDSMSLCFHAALTLFQSIEESFSRDIYRQLLCPALSSLEPPWPQLGAGWNGQLNEEDEPLSRRGALVLAEGLCEQCGSGKKNQDSHS